jgi:hypothetical protein
MCTIWSLCYSDLWHYTEKLLAWHCPTRVIVYLVHPHLPDTHMQVVQIPLHILHILGVQQVPCIMTWTYISDKTKINEQTLCFST